MKTVMRKVMKFFVKSSLLAIGTRALLAMAKRWRKPDTTQKVDEMIDKRAEQAKEMAKAGAHKTFDKLDEIISKSEQMETKAKEKANEIAADREKTTV